MQLATQIMTRNLLKQVVVLSSDPKGTEQVEWQPNGDPNGGDVQAISTNVAGLVSFTRLLNRGIIEVVEAPEEIKAALDAQTAAFRSRLDGAAANAAAAIDPAANNDFLMLPCIGPDSRGTGTCGNEVQVREKTKDDAPVLCSTHMPLRPHYVQHEEQVGQQIVKKWSRAQMTAPERQQA